MFDHGKLLKSIHDDDGSLREASRRAVANVDESAASHSAVPRDMDTIAGTYARRQRCD
jgi:hypothetical protein